MSLVWKTPENIATVLEEVIAQHHTPRLNGARFAVAFSDTKPFIKNRFNWGKVMKFSEINRIWQIQPGFDFCVVICADVWHELLSIEQRPAYLDLQVSRCVAEYEPQMIIEGKKKKPVVDEWGRTQYTNVVKTDDEGRPKWKIEPLGLEVFAQNVHRYGLWMSEFVENVGVVFHENE